MIRTMLATLAAASTVLAGPPDEVREILKNADEATKNVVSVSYHAKVYGTGAFSTEVKTTKGEVLIIKDLENKYNNAKGRAKGSTWEVGSLDASTFTVAWDGEAGYSLNESAKTLTTAEGAGGAKLLGPAQPLFMLEYAHETPFSDEVNAKFADLEGQAVVADVLCNVIYVEYGDKFDGNPKARWYFGVEDNLPRKVERLREVDGRAASHVTVIWDLKVNPEYSPSDLMIDAPTGYSIKMTDHGAK